MMSIAFVLMCRTQGYNRTLTMLLGSILGMSAMYFLFFLFYSQGDTLVFSVFLAIGELFDNGCHWIITNTYLNVSIDSAALLDKEVLLNNQVKLVEVDRKRRWLKYANVIAIVWIIAIGVLYLFGNIRDYNGPVA